MPASANPMLLTDEAFEKFRYIGDRDIDVLALTVMEVVDYGEFHQILSNLNRNGDPVSFEGLKNVQQKKDVTVRDANSYLAGYKKVLGIYFGDTFIQFTPEEKECLRKASIFFNVHMTECTIALAVRSLLKQYAAFKSTNVLAHTQLLPKYPYRRIISTMQFVMDVMESNAFEPEGYGIRAIQRLRMVHALIRIRIDMDKIRKTEGKEWNEEWGRPINQQDMIFAVHTFSIEVIHGLLASGEKVSAEDIQNYYYAWHIIGRALGVVDELNPSDYAIGVQVQERIYGKEFIKENPNGPLLAEPLINFMADVLPMADRKAVYGIVKLFNDKKDYEPIFHDILKLDLSEASTFFTSMYKTQDWVRHALIRVKHFFTPNAKRSDYLNDIAKNQRKLFEAIMAIAKTWSGNHFRMADGFGTQAAEAHNAADIAMPRWKRAVKYFFPTWKIS